jgi:hypothetical protein
MLKTRVKTYPNKVFEQEIRNQKLTCQALWQIKGPKNTAIDWITCYYIAPLTVIHFGYDEGGWDIHIGSEHIDRKSTIDDLLERIKTLRQTAAA